MPKFKFTVVRFKPTGEFVESYQVESDINQAQAVAEIEKSKLEDHRSPEGESDRILVHSITDPAKPFDPPEVAYIEEYQKDGWNSFSSHYARFHTQGPNGATVTCDLSSYGQKLKIDGPIMKLVATLDDENIELRPAAYDENPEGKTRYTLHAGVDLCTFEVDQNQG